MTHFTATWLIPLIIFGFIFIVGLIWMPFTEELEGLLPMFLLILDVIWYVVYMIVWIIIHYNQIGWFIHIKIV